ncbi:hypothetical protein [Spirosoma sp.]|uniref:hypothetical protein n=1 Tax=Spirosoma sp. TaxID=1899569 RepID=UPI0026037A56|nr:hypothetical protein [Spirosoma sp.]MCX6212837.1 hypothetical protein [Spirosoma sp.]
MKPCVQAIYNQIGQVAFARMKATTLKPDNRKNALQWKLKGTLFTSIRVEGQQNGVGYQVSFFIINHQQFTEIVIEHIQAQELISTIERITGLVLSYTPTDLVNDVDENFTPKM